MKQNSHAILSSVLIVVSIIILQNAVLSATAPNYYDLSSPRESVTRLPSNSIIDIIAHENSLWLGSGRGIVNIPLDGSSWNMIGQSEGIGRGGISALAVTDTIIWAATAYSEYISSMDVYLPAGGGVGYSRDDGNQWTWFVQPIDSVDETDYSPTTTNIQNVTYDIAISDSAVWITSWGGGLRKLPHGSVQWEVVTPDRIPFKPLTQYAHRAFSVVFANQTLFVGTAAGIWRSADEGENWSQSKFETGLPSITGNFIVALAVQDNNGFADIWAATWRAEGSLEYYGVCVSRDNGLSWQAALTDSTLIDGEYLIDLYGPLRAHNVGFAGERVFVAADKGLWISSDNGHSWGSGPLEVIYDPLTNESLYYPDFYSVVQTGDSLWVGTNEGLAMGLFDLSSGRYLWQIHRAYQPAGIDGVPDSYAYPNPFSPWRGYTTRITTQITAPSNASYEIFNFAMEPVYSSPLVVLQGDGVGGMANYGAMIWDGRGSDGQIVASGVYFYRFKVGSRTMWGKIMIIN